MPRRRDGARRSATPHPQIRLCLFLCVDNSQESSAHGKLDATPDPLLVGRTCPHPPFCAASRSYITWPSDVEFALAFLLSQSRGGGGEERGRMLRLHRCPGKKVADLSMPVAIRNLSGQTLRRVSHAVLVPRHVAIYTFDSRHDQQRENASLGGDTYPEMLEPSSAAEPFGPQKAAAFFCLSLSKRDDYGRPIWAF
ncbi:hypothetical protein V8C26DRAFT_160898 [Trichoderma gracile]